MSRNEIERDISNEPPYREIIGRDMEITSGLSGHTFRGSVTRVVLRQNMPTGVTTLSVMADWVAKKVERHWTLLAPMPNEIGSGEVILTSKSGKNPRHFMFIPSDGDVLTCVDGFAKMIVYPKGEELNLSDLIKF